MAASKKIKSLQFDNKLPIGIEIIPVDKRYIEESLHLTTPHRASFYCVLWVIDGMPTHLIDFVPITISPDSFLFVAKDRIQFFDQTTSFKSKVLLFTDASLGENPQFLFRTPLFTTFDSSKHCILKASSQLKEYWHMIERESATPGDKHQPLLLKNHLSNFLLQAERELHIGLPPEDGTSPHQEIFYQFRTLLETHFRKQAPVTFYANQLNISGKVLAHATEKLSGKTPKQLINERVLLEAKRLLIYEKEAGKNIGYTLGFLDPTNFVKFFRKHTGETPANFRKHHYPGKGQ